VKSPGARVRLAPRFEKALGKVDQRIARSAIEALHRLNKDRRHRGLNLEKIEGTTWSIRVTRNFRILLERHTDDLGEYFIATHLDTHDIYKRRR
jgi:mRNA-degrading endonuclease RelE of RelBE toxin-antitoxin system